MTASTTADGPATEPATPAGFRIIEPCFRNPLDGQYCTLAEVPGFGRLLRRTNPGSYGLPVYMYWRLDPDPGKNPEPINSYVDPFAEPHAILEQSNWNARAKLWKIETSPLESEIRRFAQQFPLMAEHYGWLRAKPNRGFEIGACWRPAQYDEAKAGEIDFERYRDRHASGDDFGIHGALAAIPPLDETTLWTIGLQPVPITNAHAIRTGVGVVKSEYPAAGPGGWEFTVTVLTAMLPDPSRNFTVIRVHVPLYQGSPPGLAARSWSARGHE